MRTSLSTLVLGTSLLSLATLPACMNGKDAATSSDDSAVTAVDSAESAGAEGDVMMAAIDGADATAAGSAALTVGGVSATIAGNITARFAPQGCATVSQSGNTIKTVYDNCTGPRGLLHVSGEMDLVISLSPQAAVTVHATSTDLKVNGASLDIDATGTYAVTGTSHTLTVSTTGTGTGPFGRTIDHEGNYTVSWDPATQCHSIDGEWSTDIGLHTRANDVSLSRCGGGCPTGSVIHTFLGGRSLTVTFDGTATASWSLAGATAGGAAEATGTVALSCQP
ncbi:MAG TPA: hypothetical protein VFP84_15075 [Kofleriaceae bacterium]|nr:hypothetical protein [Kofleriaceae bacterium]